MFQTLRNRTDTTLIVLAMLALGVACSKAPPCPSRFEASRTGECSCTGADAGSVWGSGIYTTDSAVCKAAVHAGAIPASGGNVSPKATAGCASYAASTANGVTTSQWGPFAGSYFFPGHGDGKCAAAVVVAPPAPPRPAAPAPGATCPAALSGFADAATASEFNCSCGGGAAGSVYGSGVYTADSALCAAAQHAGAIPAAGGTVKINKAAGCPKYTGTVANGMTTTSWGSYPASFFFVGHGDGKCAG